MKKFDIFLFIDFYFFIIFIIIIYWISSIFKNLFIYYFHWFFPHKFFHFLLGNKWTEKKLQNIFCFAHFMCFVLFYYYCHYCCSQVSKKFYYYLNSSEVPLICFCFVTIVVIIIINAKLFHKHFSIILFCIFMEFWFIII